jgi:hypothetical protein
MNKLRYFGSWGVWDWLLFGLLGLCLLTATCAGPAHAQSKSRPLLHPPFTTAQKPIFMRCAEPRVYDGDTIMCKSGYHLRLLGVQAPEIECKKGVECIPGDAEAARDPRATDLSIYPPRQSRPTRCHCPRRQNEPELPTASTHRQHPEMGPPQTH